MNKNELLHYTAGIIDGEGYIGLMKGYKKDSYIPTVKVASSCGILAPLMHQHYGGSLSKQRHHTSPNQKPSQQWSIRNKKRVKQFLDEVAPKLIVKRAQAEVVLDYIDKCTYKEWRTNKEQTKEIADELYEKIRELNFRGVRPQRLSESAPRDRVKR